MKFVLCLAVVFGVPLWNVCAGGLGGSNPNLADLTVTIHCTNAVIKVGDEIPVEFVISNAGMTATLAGPELPTEVGWTEEYEITVKTADGKTLPDLGGYFRDNFGGLRSMTVVLNRGEFFTKTIPLNLWAIPRSPGQYTVTGTYNGIDGYGAQPPSDIHSAPITITVLPRTEAEMDAYIDDLTNQTHVDWLRLAFTGSQKIVPCLLNGMYHESNSFRIGRALTVYFPHTGQVKEQLIEAALKWGLTDTMIYVLQQYDLSDKEWVPLIARSLREDSPETWAAGAGMAGGYYDDSFTPRLIALATGESKARDNAIFALAVNRTDASVETLKTLLKSPNRDIRLKTEEAIGIAYCYRGPNYHGQKLRPDDFDKKFQEPSTYDGLVEGKTNP